MSAWEAVEKQKMLVFIDPYWNKKCGRLPASKLSRRWELTGPVSQAT